MGYQNLTLPRPVLQRGAPPMPVVSRAAVGLPELQEPRFRHSRGRPYEAALIAEIKRQRLAGFGIRQIARDFGVPHECVSRHTRDLPPPPGGWPKITQERRVYNIEKAKRLRRAGFSFDEIGEEIGCCGSWASRLLTGRPDKRRVRVLGRMTRIVSQITGFPTAMLRREFDEHGGRRPANLAKARHILFWLAHTYQGVGYQTIGVSLGGFNHATIINGVQRVDRVRAQLEIKAYARLGWIARHLWEADWRPLLASTQGQR